MDLHEWLNLLLRWTHFIAGIAWIGSSFYFVWLDHHLNAPPSPREGVVGEIWMVHSGGFYQVERRRLSPGEVPAALHWFKWEAMITWITGMLLLAVVYYFTRGVYLIDVSAARISAGGAIALGLGAIVISWFVYDALWRSPLARSGPAATALSLGLLALVSYVLCRELSGRAAFLHLGALLGTIMVANVWVRILPAQQEMIDATKAGRAADYTRGDQAKRRSMHNSYMTFPVLFLMLSPHFPATSSGPWSWLVALLLFGAGMAARHVMIGQGPRRAWAIVPGAAALAAVLFLTAPPGVHGMSAQAAAGPPVPFAVVRNIVTARCVTCHSATPTFPTFGPRPGGVSFEDDASIRAHADRILVRVVETKTMPLGNMTAITEEERETIGRWVLQGAKQE
jgi:uncharacterized membrane protein